MTHDECLEISNLAGFMLCAVREFAAGGHEPAKAIKWDDPNGLNGFPLRTKMLVERITALRREVTARCVAVRDADSAGPACTCGFCG
jgi:hypothetical protein